MRAAFIAYTLAFLAVSITAFALRNGQVAASDAFSALTRGALSVMCIGMIVASLGVLWLSWRASSGVTRNRIGWIAVCMGLIQSSYFISQVYKLLGLEERHAAGLLRQLEEGERRLAVSEAVMAELRINNNDLRAAREGSALTTP